MLCLHSVYARTFDQNFLYQPLLIFSGFQKKKGVGLLQSNSVQMRCTRMAVTVELQ